MRSLKNPWEKVGTDLCEFRKSHYLVVVDYYSNYPEVCFQFTSYCSLEISICHTRHSKNFVSDNGPQVDSEKFRQVLKDWEIQYDLASSKYPKANGMAESTVKSVKSLFKKAHKANEDPYLALQIIVLHLIILIGSTQRRTLETSYNELEIYQD